MAQPPTRSLIGKIIKNFINSLKPRRWTGDLKGTDHFGTKYFEIPPHPSIGKRKPVRYFDPAEKDNFEQELPAEWEAWLRGRRKEPPTDEEVLRNLAVMEMKKQNAVAVEAKSGKPTRREKGMESFPERPEFERTPGAADRKE